MCYSGNCPYENRNGDCTLSAEKAIILCPDRAFQAEQSLVDEAALIPKEVWDKLSLETKNK